MNTTSAFVPDQCVGIVGLGLVGTALGKRLKAAGYQCIGFDVRAEAMHVFEAAGFKASASVGSMLHLTNTLVLAVFDTSGVQAVVEQILQQRKIQVQTTPSVITLIDCSTGDPVKLAELARQLSEEGIQFNRGKAGRTFGQSHHASVTAGRICQHDDGGCVQIAIGCQMMGLDIESGFDFLRACGNDIEAE